MPTMRTCPQCAAAFPEQGWEGLCPKCLVRVSLEANPGQLGGGTEPRQNPLPSQPDMPTAQTGMIVGRYKLLQQIGEGGFGVVFMAEQTEPIQRKVALKIVKAGMDTREVIARFEAERQALALMDHPNIAKVLDAGTTEAQRPFFVMELVRGIPITKYCDENHLSTRDRLALFVKVCRAIQHAHQKGIIHRDLKPGNVLVTLHDGEPVPKVIDFGVAKALGQKLTDKTLFTRFEQMIGTPAYMSPEQAALGGLDIDNRSDIYSLGVLLYELLTGVTPLDAETLRQGALEEIRRMIRETDPPKPSTRLLALGDRLAEVAKHRHVESAALGRLIRGDLDWITMKALEKDRRRRYDTVNGFAMDIERHLIDEPVVARPPSNFYRLQKLFQRNRQVFTAAGVVAIMLLLSVVGRTWQAIRATQAEQYQAEKATTVQLESFRIADHLQHAVLELNSLMFRYSVYHHTNDWARFGIVSTDLDRWIDEQRPILVTEKEKLILDKINTSYDFYLAAAHELDAKSRTDAKSAMPLLEFVDFQKQSQTLLNLGLDLAIAHPESMDSFFAASKKSLYYLRLLLLISVGLLLISAGGFAAVVYRDLEFQK